MAAPDPEFDEIMGEIAADVQAPVAQAPVMDEPLAVDRDGFSAAVTAAIEAHPLITIAREMPAIYSNRERLVRKVGAHRTDLG